MSNPKDLAQQGGRIIANRGIQRDVERAARVQAGNTDTTVWVAIEDITIDPAIQVRVGGGDPDTIKQYAVIMFEHQGWGPFPPVDVHRDGEAYYLSAGFQRMDSAALASEWLIAEGLPAIDEVPTTIRPGGYAAAVEFAENDNLEHGKPLSTADKFNMFNRRLDRGHRWVTMSDRAIAREIGVSHPTISAWRKSYESSLTGKNLPVRENTGKNQPRIGADGRVYKTTKIKRSNQKRATPKPAPVQEEGPSVTERIMAALHEHGALGPAHLSQVSGLSYAEFNLVMDDLIEDNWIEKRLNHSTGLVTFHALVEPEQNPNAVGILDGGEDVDVPTLRVRVVRLLQSTVEAFTALGETDEAEAFARYLDTLRGEWGVKDA